MRTFDLTPLFRNTVGFDRMANVLEGLAQETAPSYPPYNIEKFDDDRYGITMAVAGFGDDDLEIVVKENTLTVSGRIAATEGETREFLHRGIAERAFERRFRLAEHIEVADASLQNGLLHIALKRDVPEEARPKTITIGKGESPKTIQGKKAA